MVQKIMQRNMYFNTSHVNVNPLGYLTTPHIADISIHLMLMLIVHQFLYHTHHYAISIHLMLMLISYIPSHKGHISSFQYISC